VRKSEPGLYQIEGLPGLGAVKIRVIRVILKIPVKTILKNNPGNLGNQGKSRLRQLKKSRLKH
jgi:hypothetical protein